jgi:hypothetical protein
MKDTPPAVARRYRELLMMRSGAERLKMGCSMFATARALALASLRERNPLVSSSSRRRELFLRFYAADFDGQTRDRIMMHFGSEVASGPPASSPKKVPVDWDDLEVALTSNSAEMTCYLDVRSGRVEMIGPYTDEDVGPSTDQIDDGLAGGYLIRVEPLGSSVEYGWMTAFTATLTDGALRGRLDVALHGRGAFRRFKNVLADAPHERERWFRFRDDRLRAAAHAWLADHDLLPTTEPPRHLARRGP